MKKNSFPYCCLLLALLLVSSTVLGQKVIYGEKEFNAEASNYQIIGKVKNNIIVWVYSYKFPSTPDLYIYNDEMRLINHVKPSFAKPNKFFDANFINCKDSFQLIYQCENNKHYVCRLVSFDENCNVLHTINIENATGSWPLNKKQHSFYEVIPSENKKSFALAKSIIDSAANTLHINYRFFEKGKEYSGTAILPYNYNYALLGNSILNNKGELILNISEFEKSFFNIGIFKIDLKNNNVTNTLRKLQSGYLVNDGIINYLNGYIVYSQWKGQQKSGIFIWKLNNDLSDMVADTVIASDTAVQTLITNIEVFNHNNFTNGNKKIDLLVSSVKIDSISSVNFNPPVYIYSGQSDGTNYLMPLPNYTRYFDNLHDFRTPALSTDVYPWQSNSIYNNPSSAQVPGEKPNMYNDDRVWLSDKPEDFKLSLLQVSGYNYVTDSLIFTGAIDTAFKSDISRSEVFETSSGLNILFEQLLKDHQVIGHIKILPDNKFTYSHIILMDLKRQLLLHYGLQINDDAVVFPCMRGNKLSFAKIVF